MEGDLGGSGALTDIDPMGLIGSADLTDIDPKGLVGSSDLTDIEPKGLIVDELARLELILAFFNSLACLSR